MYTFCMEEIEKKREQQEKSNSAEQLIGKFSGKNFTNFKSLETSRGPMQVNITSASGKGGSDIMVRFDQPQKPDGVRGHFIYQYERHEGVILLRNVIPGMYPVKNGTLSGAEDFKEEEMLAFRRELEEILLRTEFPADDLEV